MISNRFRDRSLVTRQAMLALLKRHFRRRPKTLFPACRMLSRHEAERHAIGRLLAQRQKIAVFAEGLRELSEGDQSCGDQRSNTRNCHQSTRHIILFGTPPDQRFTDPEHLCGPCTSSPFASTKRPLIDTSHRLPDTTLTGALPLHKSIHHQPCSSVGNFFTGSVAFPPYSGV